MLNEFILVFLVHARRATAYSSENNGEFELQYADGADTQPWCGNETIAQTIRNLQINIRDTSLRIMVFSDREEDLNFENFKGVEWKLPMVWELAKHFKLSARQWYLNGERFRHRNLKVDGTVPDMHIVTFPVLEPVAQTDVRKSLIAMDIEEMERRQNRTK